MEFQRARCLYHVRRERVREAARYRGPYILQIEYRLLCVKYKERSFLLRPYGIAPSRLHSQRQFERECQFKREQSWSRTTDITPIPIDGKRGKRECNASRISSRNDSRSAFHIDPIPDDCRRFPANDRRSTCRPFDFHLFRKTCSRKHLVRHLLVTRQREKKKGNRLDA